MKIHSLVTAAAVALALSAAPAFAKKEKVDKGHDPSMSSQGMHNTNSPYSTDRDKGQARSAERMSDSGTAHTHSGDPQKDKEKKAKKAK